MVIKKILHLEMHAPLEDAWGAVPLMDYFLTLGLREVTSHKIHFILFREREALLTLPVYCTFAEISFGPTRRCII